VFRVGGEGVGRGGESRGPGWDPVNTVINLTVPEKARKFLTS
jgi:hypothetical protein